MIRVLKALQTSYDKVSQLLAIIDPDVDIGADAVDYNLETEMHKLEGEVKEILDELECLKRHEERFISTNASTNVHVQNFAWLSIILPATLGVWQILHLHACFKRKYLIDYLDIGPLFNYFIHFHYAIA
ncbi:hypothetical protein P691DRAFT_788539 [Macrolepiota fuliginosa MF-IS2]|uniref:GOLD domain-containing protein n=1 Tax=Macrolepiota fuliginosa MF-IS2 TaxID=1400762 RepID=A0A9P6BZ27_9AGAR|nr:hypothetical protein P691DRAFT_788539 [Macrolepiota fuliginosa MF-IS2]